MERGECKYWTAQEMGESDRRFLKLKNWHVDQRFACSSKNRSFLKISTACVLDIKCFHLSFNEGVHCPYIPYITILLLNSIFIPYASLKWAKSSLKRPFINLIFRNCNRGSSGSNPYNFDTDRDPWIRIKNGSGSDLLMGTSFNWNFFNFKK